MKVLLLGLLLFQKALAITNTLLSATLTPLSSTVSQSAALTFSISVSTALPLFTAGDCIKFTVANPYVTGSTDPNLISIQNYYKAFPGAPSGVTCSSFTSGVTLSCSSNTNFVLSMQVGMPSLPGVKTFSGKITNFNNPFSTVPVTMSVGYYSGCTGTAANQISQTLQFVSGSFNLAPPDVALTSSSNVIGDTNKVLTVAFKPNTILQVAGSINLVVPPYYSLSTGDSQQSMINYDPNNLPVVSSTTMTISNQNFRPTDRTLTFNFVIAAVATNTITIPLSFQVTQFNNPINSQPLGGFKLSTFDPNGNAIDATSGSFTLTGVTVAATITTASLQLLRVADSLPDNQIAQKNRMIQVSFSINFPVIDNCFIKVSFPEDVKVNCDETIDTYSGQGFISNSILPNQIVIKPYVFGANLATCDCNYVLAPGCQDVSFLGASGQGILNLQRVVSPCQVRNTGNFQIDFYQDQSMSSLIATTRTNLGLNLNILAGSWAPGTVTPSVFRPITDNTIQDTTDFTATFAVTHNLYQNSIIDITLPALTQTMSPTCTIMSVSSQFDSTIQCSVFQTTPTTIFRITNPFSQSRPELWAMIVNPLVSTSGTLTLQINGIKNPASVQSAGIWSVKTQNLISGAYAIVDTGTAALSASYTPVQGTLTAYSTGGLIISDKTTFITTASYRFLITIQHPVPQGGKIVITMPTDFSIPGSVTCYHQNPSISSTAYNSQPCSNSGNTITVTLSDPTHPANVVLDLKILGIKNPRTFQPTNNVNINTYDSSMNMIDQGTGFSTQMTVMNTFPSFSATMLNSTNGAVTTYTITFSTQAIAVTAGDIMYLAFPSNVLLPSNAVCKAYQGITSISCTNSGQNMIVHLAGVASTTTLAFQVLGVQNPSSTAVSPPFSSIYMTDFNGNNVQQLLSTVLPTVQTTKPANILTYSLYQNSLTNGAAVTYRISFTPTNQISTTGTIVLGWPSQALIYSNVSCFVTTNQKYGNLCTLNMQTRNITISGAFAGMTSYYSGSILIELSPVTNPWDNRVVNGFTIETYDDAAMTQVIDVLFDNILVPQTQCNYPCESCLGQLPDYCLQCWQKISLKYLQQSPTGSTCVSKCSPGFTTNGDKVNRICVPCDATCKTCIDQGLSGDKFKCLTCSVSTPYFYPLTQSCDSKCEPGFFLYGNYTCSPCAAPCYECQSKNSTCTSCYQGSTKPLLLGSTCVASCPYGYTGVSQVCLPCLAPCATCMNSTSQCLSCNQNGNQKYLFANQCYTVCPNGTVAENQQMVCKGCLAGCNKCDANNQTICYECSDPLILYQTQCLNNCPAGMVTNSSRIGCTLVPVKDLSLIYFPFLICCAFMTILAFGGYLKDRKSLIISNIIVFWAPVEVLSFIVQLGLSVFFASITEVAAAGLAIMAYIIVNMVFVCVFECRLGMRDDDYKFYRQVHPTTSRFITVMSSVVSFKIIRLKYSYLYGFDNFKAKFTHVESFRSVLIWFTLAHIVCSNFIIMAIDALYLKSNFALDSQLKITMIETAVISLLMICLQLRELCRVRAHLLVDYTRMEGDSLHSVHQEESMDKQMRRNMLRKIMQQFKGSQDLINEASVSHKLDELIQRFRPRRCNSISPFENDREDDPRRVSSEPPTPKPEWDALDRVPSRLVFDDNVYTESKPSDPLGKLGKTYSDADTQIMPDEFAKALNKRGVDFIYSESGMDTARGKRKDKNRKRGRKNQYYTQIDAEDDEEADQAVTAMGPEEVMQAFDQRLAVIQEEIKEEPKRISNSKPLSKSPPRVAFQEQPIVVEDQSKRFKEEQKRLEEDIVPQTFRPIGDEPLVQVPPDSQKRNFNEHDILGLFDRDEKGNIVILQDASGNWVDKLGRRVNERGYLVDVTGGIVEGRQQQVMFLKEDVDDRGEIPAPFCVEKHNFNPFNLRGDLDRTRRVSFGKDGETKDKLGRLINKRGWLVDGQGHIVDYNGVKKFDRRQLTKETGDLPKLFNYNGQRFDIMDVCGTFDMDHKAGKIILKQNAQGQNFDNQGRLVNEKGYLIDYMGNVVDKEGRKIFDKKYLSSNGDFPKIFPFTRFNVKNIQGEFEMDPSGNPILERGQYGFLVDRQGKRVNSRGYYCDEAGNIVDKKGKVMFHKDILEADGEIPEVFRAGLLKSDSASSLSRLMSEIERNQPEEVYNEERKSRVIVSKNSGGNSSVNSQMDDTPSNYNAMNQRLHTVKKMVKIDEVVSTGSMRKKNSKRKKQVVQEYSNPSDRDIQMAKAYGGIARGLAKKRDKGSPSSTNSKQSKLKKVSGSVAGLQKNHQRDIEETKGELTLNRSANILNETGDPSVMAVPEHHIREQKLKKQKIQELKMKAKLKKKGGVAGGPTDADFEKLFGRDIDEFLEDSEWDIESFENLSNFSRGTARSAFLDNRLRGLESIYLQRLDSAMKKPGSKAKKERQKPRFRVMQDRFVDDPAALQDVEVQSSNMSQQRAQQKSQMSAKRGQTFGGTQQHFSKAGSTRNKVGTSQTQYRQQQHRTSEFNQ